MTINKAGYIELCIQNYKPHAIFACLPSGNAFLSAFDHREKEADSLHAAQY